MSYKSLGNPYDSNNSLVHTKGCACDRCQSGGATSLSIMSTSKSHGQNNALTNNTPASAEKPLQSAEDYMDRAVENAIVRAVFQQDDFSRRRFLRVMGGGTLAAALASVLPMGAIKAAAQEFSGPLEKKKLAIGFIPITCATPIIMAHPMGFYARNGLEVDVIKTAGWAVIRDKSLAGEYDASHMLTPMPIAMSMGVGSTAKPFIVPAIENINGQAIVLHVKHQDKRDPKQWKGFRFGVPFEYSMHNFLLRYYLAEHGLDPDRDVQIRVVPPPDMVANLRAGNLDGYLSPDPFNQRAVWEKVGFIHMLTKELWDGHPCCAFACTQEFAATHPNTYGALLKSIVEATYYSSNPDNRKDIAAAIAPTNYLNQPVPVIEQVLLGRYADGLGAVKNDPNRIDFDPFPWHSMAVWILTQMKRWGYIKGDMDYQKIAREIYLATDCARVMKELGYEVPTATSKSYFIMGKEFDPQQADAYVDSFAIRRGDA